MSLRVGLACVLIVCLTSGVAAGTGVGVTPQPAAAADIEYDTTLLRIDLQENGDAGWTIEYRVDLNDQNATEAFEALREDIRANRSEFEGGFADRMNRTARAAENTTGRGMAIRDVSVETDRDEIQQVGIVAYNFTWTNFAVADGDELRAGDAISGFVLGEGTTLFFTWPDTYGATDITPPADESSKGSATWLGQEAFANDEPRLVLERGVNTPDGGDGPPGGGTTTAAPDEGGLDVLLLVIGVVVAGLAAGGWYVWKRGEGTPTGVTGDDTVDVAGVTSGETDGENSKVSGAADGADDEDPPEELLSNEERVLRLIEGNGGRMKQQQVVRELDWTDAKTSQVVGNLRDDGDIEVFRIGRENVLALPGETDFR